MKTLRSKLLVILTFTVFGASSLHALSLAEYLEQVRTNGRGYRALSLQSQSYSIGKEAATQMLDPIAYVDINKRSDEKPPQNPAMGTRTDGTQWRVGLKKQTTFGLNANAFIEQTHIDIRDASPQFVPQPDVYETRVGVEVRQNLWKNGFGSQLRHDIESQVLKSESEQKRAQYQAESLEAQAANIYWYLSAMSEIIKLQEVNLTRAEKLSSWMANRVNSNLADKADLLAIQSAAKLRSIELQNSRAERESVYLNFQNLRGQSGGGTLPALDPSESAVMQIDSRLLTLGSRSRSDYTAQVLAAHSGKEQSMARLSALNPQLDLMASYSTNGRDPEKDESFDAAQGADTPTWTLGLSFAVSTDFGLTNSLRSSARFMERASEEMAAQAKNDQTKSFADLVKKLEAAQTYYEAAVQLQNLRSQLVSQENTRIKYGRTTTLQLVTAEQDLASAQISRIRAKLSILQIINELKLFKDQT